MTDREQFEALISAPPYEHVCDIHGPESAWPGQYKNPSVQLAWEMWQAAKSDSLDAAFSAAFSNVAIGKIIKLLIRGFQPTKIVLQNRMGERCIVGTHIDKL